MSLVNSLLSGRGLSSNYLDSIIQLQSIRSLLDPDSLMNNYSNSYYGNSIPKQSTYNRCSKLAKLIQQLTNSYRQNIRFEDLTYRAEKTSSISDPVLRSKIDRLTNSTYNRLAYESEDSAAKLNGYSNESAINASFASAVENIRVINEINAGLDEVDGDLVKYDLASNKSISMLSALIERNKVTEQRLVALEENLLAIRRKNSFYNLSTATNNTRNYSNSTIDDENSPPIVIPPIINW